MNLLTASKRLHSVPEGAEELGISEPTLRRAIALKKVRTVTIGSRRLISSDELDRIAREGLDLHRGGRLGASAS
jgi:excisionase family DNA binding protein